MMGAATRADCDVVLVLGGGNALGAFQAGFYQALHEHDLLPDWIVGTSVGAINGALIGGSARDDRVDTLRRFWRPDDFGLPEPGTFDFPAAADIARRTAAAGWTMAAGRPGLFGPPLSAMMSWTADRPAIFETDELEATLARLADFDLLNSATCRYTATAVDLETGDDVVFDTRDRRVDPRHVRASAALPVAFPPVRIDDRWLVDGGLSANLPFDPVLADPCGRAMLVLAVELLPLAQRLPTTIGEAAGRMQDLIFAAQSRRTIDRWRMAHAGRDDVRIALVPVAYTDQALEVAGKAMDFSGPTIARRWAAGQAAALPVIAAIASGALPIGATGLHVVAPEILPPAA